MGFCLHVLKIMIQPHCYGLGVRSGAVVGYSRDYITGINILRQCDICVGQAVLIGESFANPRSHSDWIVYHIWRSAYVEAWALNCEHLFCLRIRVSVYSLPAILLNF